MRGTSIQVLAKYYHTPGRDYRHLFHAVLTAGHARLDPDYYLTTWSHPGHDFVLSVEGTGLVQIGNKTLRLSPGELVWGNCNDRNIGWPSRAEPWTMYWVRVDSEQMSLLSDVLGVSANPIFVPRDMNAVIAVFEEVLGFMRDRPITIDAALNAAIGKLIAILFEARLPREAQQQRAPDDARVTPDLHRVLNAIRSDYRRRWTIRDLAQLMGASEPQFFRRFRQATGSSPMDYLRRERINHAKRSLADSLDSVSSIAEQVGYSDPYYFSRDFKKLVGIAPRHYRARDQAGERKNTGSNIRN